MAMLNQEGIGILRVGANVRVANQKLKELATLRAISEFCVYAIT